MARKKKLTKRQTGILEFIAEYVRDNGYPPTIREIGKAVGITSTSVVNYNLNRLAERGFLLRERDVSRGLRLIDQSPEILPAGRLVREWPCRNGVGCG